MSTVRTATSILAGTSIVVPAALLAVGLSGPVDAVRDLGRPAVALTTGTASSATGFATGTVEATTGFAGGTAGSALATVDATVEQAVERTVPAVLETATTTVDATVDAALGTAEQVVEAALDLVEHGSATACPGAPVSTGVELRPGDTIALSRPLALQTPRAAVTTAAAVLDGTSVALPSVGTLLDDPASVSLQGPGTGVAVSLPVVDEVLDGTSVQVGPASVQPATGAASADVATATALAPQVEVGLGRQLLRLDESATVTTAGLGGPLTLRVVDGGSCTAVTWTITR